MIADVLRNYRERGAATLQPMDRWNDGASYLIGRHLRTARRLMQSGRHQVATRELQQQLERLKEAWDAYRAATGS